MLPREEEAAQTQTETIVRITVGLTKDAYTKLSERADKELRTISNMAAYLIEKSLEESV